MTMKVEAGKYRVRCGDVVELVEIAGVEGWFCEPETEFEYTTYPPCGHLVDPGEKHPYDLMERIEE